MKKAGPRRLRKIAVVLPHHLQQINDVALGAARFARASGQIELCDVPFASHLEIPQRLKRLRADGAILWLASTKFEEIRGALPPGLPLVGIGIDRLAPDIDGVCSSDQGMVDLTYQHLAQAGYERFAMVGLRGSTGIQRRLEMLRNRAPRAAEVSIFDLPQVYDDETVETKLNRALQRWLRELRPPVGIITWCRSHAQVVCLACRRLGLNVPRDVGVLSAADTRAGVMANPPISAVRVDGDGLGYAAMKLLVARLSGRRPPEELVQVPPSEVIARGSAERERPRSGHIALAVAYIEQHAYDGISVEDVGRTTQTTSRRKFYDDFIAEVGCPPAEYIRRLKIARAKELLGSTSLSIKRIASASGFQSVAHFYVTFSQHADLTPLEYRQQRRKNGERRTTRK